MSKIGISTVQSYKGAQIFEAVGLGPQVMELCFSGTPSRISGIGFEHFQADALRCHAHGWPSTPSTTDVMLPNPGDYHYRDGGEAHYNSPAAMAELQVAARTNSRKAYAAYANTIIEQSRAVSIRGLLQFRERLLALSL